VGPWFAAQPQDVGPNQGVKTEATIFYSWQSDTAGAANRSFILTALEGAVAELRADDSIAIDPAIDRDTSAVAGAPDIGATILDKIDACSVFVADVTIVNSETGGRPAPNPNVLIELGYALKSVGWSRCILVQNTAFGGPELLPFDLRQKRATTYRSPEDAPERATERRALQSTLKEAVRLVLEGQGVRTARQYPVSLDLQYDRKNITQSLHEYVLRVELTNDGSVPIDEWHVDVELPTILLRPNVTYAPRVGDRSDNAATLFRSTQGTHPSAIFPGDTKTVLTVDYRVDEAVYARMPEWFAQSFTAWAYIAGEVTEASTPAGEMQVF